MIGSVAWGSMEATLVKKVVEGVIWPAAGAGEVTSIDVRAEASRVRRGEGIAHRKAEGNGGGEGGEEGETPAGDGVSGGGNGHSPKRLLPSEGVQESILISEGVPTNAP